MRLLAEDLLLFALDDDKGTTDWTGWGELPFALAGALLADLALLQRIELREEEKVALLDATPTGDPLLDAALTRIANSEKPHDAEHWVTTLNSKVEKLQDRLEERLVFHGILRREEHRILFIFPSDRYPTADASVERELHEQIRAVLLTDESPDPRTVVLISLLRSCKLLDGTFSKDERRVANDRAEAVIEDERAGAAGAAVKAAADAAAATAAVIATTVVISGAVAASSSSS